jgi:hypothetical protein
LFACTEIFPLAESTMLATAFQHINLKRPSRSLPE